MAYSSSWSNSGNWGSALLDVTPALRRAGKCRENWEPVFTRCAVDAVNGFSASGEGPSSGTGSGRFFQHAFVVLSCSDKC